MKRNSISTAGAALILCLSGTVAAQQTAAPEDHATTQPAVPATPHQAQTAQEVTSELFNQLDKDRNGTVSQQEAQAHPGLSGKWSNVDEDGDGQLDPAEFSEYERMANADGTAAPTGAMGDAGEGLPSTRHQEQTVGDDLVGELDKDGDGQISQQEAQVEAQLSDDWDQLDKNRDGQLDPDELSDRDQ